MMKSILSITAILAMTVSANAALIATDNFETGSIGLTGWSISTAPGGTASIQTDSDPAHNKVLEMTSDGTGDSSAQWNYEPIYSSAGGAIQFDLKLIGITSPGIVRVGDVTAVSMVGASARAGAYFSSPTPGVTDNSGDNGYAAFPGSTDGAWHTVDVVVGPSSATGGTGGGGGGTEAIYFDYVLVSSGLYSSAPGYAVEFGINTQVVTAHDIVVDNIRVGDTFDDVAPEPASLSLLGVGGLLVLKRRRAA